MEPEKQKRDYILPASILIAALMVVIALVYSAGKNAGDPAENPKGPAALAPGKIDVSSVAFLGKSDAPGTLLEYGDYQCPYCGRFFEETEPLIIKEYVDTGKVKFGYKDMAFLGPESVAAAEAAACAQDQGKFWEYHDALYAAEIKEDETDDGEVNGSAEGSGNLARALFLALAKGLGLNESDFAACLDSKKYESRVQSSTAEAGAVMGDKASTPTFFMNGKLLFQGAYPFASFKQAMDQILNK
jgi:protein-disulfide isomerase